MLNLTPHKITIQSENGNITVIEPSGHVAKIIMEDLYVYNTIVGGVDVPTILQMPHFVLGIDEDVLDKHRDGIFVDKSIIDCVPSELLEYRIYAPDTGASAIRNEKGQVEAVTRLVTRKI